jgi:hypothetical protein
MMMTEFRKKEKAPVRVSRGGRRKREKREREQENTM